MNDVYQRKIDLKQTTHKDEIAIILLQGIEVSFTSFQFVNNKVCSEYSAHSIIRKELYQINNIVPISKLIRIVKLFNSIG